MWKIYLLLIMIFALPSQLQADVTLSFGIYSSDKPTRMVRKFRPVLNYLERDMSVRMGEKVRIRLQVFPTYEGGIDAIVTGQVDFARLGPASYVFARQAEAGLTILALESKRGQKVFKGIICVQNKGNIHQISDLKGRSFAFGNSKSTIGRYLSQNHMMENGIYAKDLKSYAYLGRHDKVGMAVADGRFDAGALKEGTFRKLIAKGMDLRKLAEFDNVTKPWVARRGLDKEIWVVLQKSLFDLTDAETLKGLGKQGFLRGQDVDYEITRKAIFQNKQFFEGGG